MYALTLPSWIPILCGKYAAANAHSDEAVALAEEKGTLMWKALGTVTRGCVLALTSNASDAVQMIKAGITAWQSTGPTFWTPWYLSNLAGAHAQLGEVNEAGRVIDEAMITLKTAKENWCEAEVCRLAGEIALKSSEPDVAKAETYFQRALAVARKQQAKSWELRAAMSTARLWRDQGEQQQACELLAPVCGWFSEGFDTLDLKEAKALLKSLAAQGNRGPHWRFEMAYPLEALQLCSGSEPRVGYASLPYKRGSCRRFLVLVNERRTSYRI